MLGSQQAERCARPHAIAPLYSEGNIMKFIASILTAVVASALQVGQAGKPADADGKKFEFRMVRGAKLVNSGGLPHAAADVTIKPGGPVEVMDVNVSGLPRNTY